MKERQTASMCEACGQEIRANHHTVTTDGAKHYFHEACGDAAMRLYRRSGAAIRFTYKHAGTRD